MTGADVAGDGYGGGILARARESAKKTLGGPSEPADSAAPTAP